MVLRRIGTGKALEKPGRGEIFLHYLSIDTAPTRRARAVRVAGFDPAGEFCRVSKRITLRMQPFGREDSRSAVVSDFGSHFVDDQRGIWRLELNMDISIKPARIEDAEQLAHVQFNSVHGTGAKFYSREVCQEWSPVPSPKRTNGFIKAISSGQEIMFVAWVGGEMAGFASIVPAGSELRAVYVDPKFGNLGVGKMLLQRVELEARNRGITKLEMHASLSAEDFYKSQGYIVLERIDHTLGSGKKMPAIKMEKVLG